MNYAPLPLRRISPAQTGYHIFDSEKWFQLNITRRILRTQVQLGLFHIQAGERIFTGRGQLWDRGARRLTGRGTAQPVYLYAEGSLELRYHTAQDAAQLFAQLHSSTLRAKTQHSLVQSSLNDLELAAAPAQALLTHYARCFLFLPQDSSMVAVSCPRHTAPPLLLASGSSEAGRFFLAFSDSQGICRFLHEAAARRLSAAQISCDPEDPYQPWRIHCADHMLQLMFQPLYVEDSFPCRQVFGTATGTVCTADGNLVPASQIALCAKWPPVPT